MPKRKEMLLGFAGWILPPLLQKTDLITRWEKKKKKETGRG